MTIFIEVNLQNKLLPSLFRNRQREYEGATQELIKILSERVVRYVSFLVSTHPFQNKRITKIDESMLWNLLRSLLFHKTLKHFSEQI